MKNIPRIAMLLFLASGFFLPVGTCFAAGDVRFGYWSLYTDPNAYQPDWDELTHIAYSAWLVNGNGTLTADPIMNMAQYTAVRDAAKSRGKTFVISVVNGDPDAIDNILANHRQDFADSALAVIQANGAEGIDLDLEFPRETNQLTGTPNAPLFAELMKTLNQTLKAADPAYKVSFCTSWGFEQAYRSAAINPWIDYIFLMGYEYNFSHSGYTGPTAPLKDPARADIKETVETIKRYYDAQKIILGVPFYGHTWLAASGEAGATITGSASDDGMIGMKEAIDLAALHGRIWDADSHTPWTRWQDGGGVWHQVWYDDGVSLQLKYDYARQAGLGGIGWWALGYEMNYPAVWEKMFLDEHYTLTVNSGGGSGGYHEGDTITLSASAPPAGRVFDRWTGDTAYISDVNAASAYVTMPNKAITLTAAFKNAASAWFDAGYQYRRAVTVDHAKVAGAGQTDFPVLVSLTDASLRTAAHGGKVRNADGCDIIFVNAAGTATLDHEIESYDAASGAIVMWVKLPVLSSSADTIFYLYYGNPSVASSREHGAAVWDDGGSNGFKAVQHMHRDPAATAAAPQLKDSTAYANNGSSFGAMTASNLTAGQIGNAVSFDGTDDAVSLGNGASLDITGSLTLSAWVKTVADNRNKRILSKLDPGAVTGYDLCLDFEGNWGRIAFGTENGSWQELHSGGEIADGAWHYIAATYEAAGGAGNRNIFMDGEMVRQDTYAGGLSSSLNSLDIASVGHADNFFNGAVDEVRVSNVARSAGWIRTEYNNQSSPSTFLSLAGEESVPGQDQQQQIPPDPEQRRIRAWPNPADFSKAQKITIAYTVSAESSVSISIYSIAGELVKTLADNKTESPGKHYVYWQGDTHGGGTAASGLYFCVVKIGNTVKLNKIVVVR